MPTTFYNPGRLVDNDLSLTLLEMRDVALPQIPTAFYRFAMMPTGNIRATPMGFISLRIGNTPDILLYRGHIGYSVEPDFRGNRFAARSCRLLLPLARRHNLNPLWITCNPDNIPSRRTCERVGATFVEIVEVPPDAVMYSHGVREKCRYRLDL